MSLQEAAALVAALWPILAPLASALAASAVLALYQAQPRYRQAVLYTAAQAAVTAAEQWGRTHGATSAGKYAMAETQLALHLQSLGVPVDAGDLHTAIESAVFGLQAVTAALPPPKADVPPEVPAETPAWAGCRYVPPTPDGPLAPPAAKEQHATV